MSVEHFIWTRRKDGYGYLVRPDNSRVPSNFKDTIETVSKGGALPRNTRFFRAVAIRHAPPDWVAVFLAFCGSELLDFANPRRRDVRFIHTLVMRMDDFYRGTSEDALKLILDVQAAYSRFTGVSGVWAGIDTINTLIRVGQQDNALSVLELRNELNSIIDWTKRTESNGAQVPPGSVWTAVKPIASKFFIENSLAEHEPHATMLATAFRVANYSQQSRNFINAASYRCGGDHSGGEDVLASGVHFVALPSQMGKLIAINNAECAATVLIPSMHAKEHVVPHGPPMTYVVEDHGQIIKGDGQPAASNSNKKGGSRPVDVLMHSWKRIVLRVSYLVSAGLVYWAGKETGALSNTISKNLPTSETTPSNPLPESPPTNHSDVQRKHGVAIPTVESTQVERNMTQPQETAASVTADVQHEHGMPQQSEVADAPAPKDQPSEAVQVERDMTQPQEAATSVTADVQHEHGVPQQSEVADAPAPKGQPSASTQMGRDMIQPQEPAASTHGGSPTEGAQVDHIDMQ